MQALRKGHDGLENRKPKDQAMSTTEKSFTPPSFVEMPSVQTFEVVKEGDRVDIDFTYVSPENRKLTIRMVLSADKAKDLAELLK